MLSVHDIPHPRHCPLSREQATNIIHHHFTEHRNSDVQIAPVPGAYHHYAKSTVYLIDILPINADTTERVLCFLILSTLDNEDDKVAGDDIYRSNSLSTVLALSKLIREHTDMPIPKHTLDTSLSIVPYHYLLSPLLPIPEGRVLISLSEARQEGLLSPVEDTRMDMRVGQYLGQMHANIQNDWFGAPQPETKKKTANDISTLFSFMGASTPPGGDAAYSWQETFVTLFEIVLARVEEFVKKHHHGEQKDQGHRTNGRANGIANGNGTTNGTNGKIKPKYVLPSQDIHRSLSRAISFFLFDDVEVPSLVSHTGSADDIFITIPAAAHLSGSLEGLPPITLPLPDPEIAYILPTLTHALWGDPLIETMFTPPGPSPAVLEGYAGAGGGPLIVFPRQRTKRLWYTLFSALLVLAEVGVVPSGDQKQEGEGKLDFAWKTVEDCVEALKDAPCY